MSTLIRWFDEIGIDDVLIVGGKNASLGEMYRELTKRGVNVRTASRPRLRPTASFSVQMIWNARSPTHSQDSTPTMSRSCDVAGRSCGKRS